VEADLFFESLLAGDEEKQAPKPVDEGPPFTVTGAEPRIRDVYPVLLQPPAPGSLSGWVGRYAAPAPGLRFEVRSPLLAGGSGSLEAALPERATDARDLPRRWARARVDALLMLIEKEGEKREWIEEIIALSKRYKFVTPYTAFLAAPRSLLRPRRIQPGDPVLRIECDPGIVSAVALFPFGLRLPLVRRPGSSLWEGRFLVPEGLKDGRYAVRVVLRDRSGARVTESKAFVLDGKAPEVRPDPLGTAHAGDQIRVAVRTDEDVILLSARLADGPPVPLRWDPGSKRSVGVLRVPSSLSGAQELVFEAVDAAKNVGFARSVLEVRR
jgi:Ca-activated chloride channel family protein